MRRNVRRLILLLLALVTTRCGSASSQPATLLVAAAADLAATMPALTAAFQRETGVVVAVTHAASGQLAQQILQGAPVDVFLSADRGWVERLHSAGRIEPGSQAVYAYGRLVIVSMKNARERTIQQLADPGVGRIAIANPEHAPYGRAAREALARAGVLERLGQRLVFAENVRQTMQMLEAGAVDAAVGALSLVDPDTHVWALVPSELHAPLEQTAAIVAGRPRRAEAEAFLRFLLGPAGREILGTQDFGLPDTP